MYGTVGIGVNVGVGSGTDEGVGLGAMVLVVAAVGVTVAVAVGVGRGVGADVGIGIEVGGASVRTPGTVLTRAGMGSPVGCIWASRSWTMASIVATKFGVGAGVGVG